MSIDLKSQLFQKELESTGVFAKKTCRDLNLYPNPDKEVNKRIYTGLTRNKLIHGKRYCPCFIVVGNNEKEKENNNNRICPCIPAIEEEIPTTGKCHCGIFCSSKYIANYNNFNETKMEKKSNLSKKEIEMTISKNEISGEELCDLLEFRKNGLVDFILVDVREEEEYRSNKIVGVDHLIPTSDFYNKINLIADKKESSIILQCHSGGRSHQVQNLMKKMGYLNVINLSGGISHYKGDTKQG